MSQNRKINRRDFIKMGAMATGGLVLSACAPQAATTPVATEVAAASSSEKKLKFYCVPHGSPSDSFFGAMSRGFDAFCKPMGVDGQFLGTVKDVDVAEAAKNLERAVAQGDGDAFIVVVSAPEMQETSLRKLAEQNIPVVAINSKDFRPADQRVPYIRYVGEDSYGSGFVNATKALESFQKLAGRPPKRSVFLNHAPQVQVLAERYRGMKAVMEPAGSVMDEIPVETDPTKLSEAVRAYIDKNPDTETVHTGWSRPAAWTLDVLKTLGKAGNVNEPFKEGNIYVTAIDIDEDFLLRVSRGEAVGTVDQQPYLQGWMGAAVAYNYVTGYFLPGDDIATGGFFVDQSNALRLVDLAKEGIR